MAEMLKRANQHVTLYAPHGSTAPCDEFVELVSEDTLASRYPGSSIAPSNAPLLAGREDPAWTEMRERGPAELKARYQLGDIALISFGHMQDWIPRVATLNVEFCCGYSGVFTGTRVFPSRSWQHQIYGMLGAKWGGGWMDAVIPHMLDGKDFDPCYEHGKYLLCLGRLNMDKGTDIAIDIATRCHTNIVIAGGADEGNYVPDFLKGSRGLPNVRFVGRVNPTQRHALLRQATALLSPCRYVEAFGLTTIEALACGTPVIGPAFGAFPEIIEDGKTGFLCHDMVDFCRAVSDVGSLSRHACRQSFDGRFSLEAVWPQYRRYFERVQRLVASGWYETNAGTWRGEVIAQQVNALGRNGTPVQGAEIGCDIGELSQCLLRELPNLNLLMVDSYPVGDRKYQGSGDHHAFRTAVETARDRAEATERTAFAEGRRRQVFLPSKEAVQSVDDASLDFAFIDADHQLAAVREDIEAWYPKVVPGGLLMGHDWKNHHVTENGVADAVGAFAHEQNLKVELYADWVWLLRKPVATPPVEETATTV